MALPISQNRAGGNSPGNLFATATEFTPKPIKAKEQVINTSFITQAVPSVHRYAGVVALCAVPKERADMNDLGWHIANFLAFRALLCGENPPKAQTWLSQCDIAALVEKNPEQFIHGKDKRLVGVAAKSTTYKRAGVVVDREDNIQVETSAENLRDKFIQAVKEKMEIVKQRGYPLLIIICGLTTLEQDVYFGKLDIDHRCTMGEMRQAFGNGINDIDVIVVTASIFSAGWHINPTFGRFHDTSVRANRTELLARQFGGLFAKELVESFLGWKCPVLDVNRIDEQIRLSERFPGPAKPSSEVKELISKLQIKIQSCLVGQLSASHMDHSFSFDETKDEWSILVGHRERSAEYQSLNEYELKWNKLPTAQHIGVAKEQLKFLGNAFGGSKISQMNHIKYLIEESFQAWPDHWASSFGQETKRDLERFLMQENPEELDCHEIFNVLEHRAATSVLADMIVGYFDLPVPHNQRCRDWDYLHWRDETSGADRSALINNFGTVLNCVPGPNVPPGVNPNMFSKIQRRLESAANYIRASLGIRFLTSQDTGKAAIDRIHMFLQEVKVKQAELLASDEEVHQMCSSWLRAIEMPIRGLTTAATAALEPSGVAAPVVPADVQDAEDEYVVVRGPDAPPARDLNFTAMGLRYGHFIQELSTAVAIVGQALEERVLNTELPATTITRADQQPMAETNHLLQDLENLQAEEDRLIHELTATTERPARASITTALYKLGQRLETLETQIREGNSAAQGSVSKTPDDENGISLFSTKTKENGHSSSKKYPEASKGGIPQATPQILVHKPQDRETKMPLHNWSKQPDLPGGGTQAGSPQTPVKSQQAPQRKTPPHLRRYNFTQHP